MPDMIRPFVDRDLIPMLDVWEAASRLAHPFLTDAFIVQERLNIPQVYMPLAKTWIAERDGLLIGFVALIGNEIGGLFVDPDRHRKGTGTKLLNFVRARQSDLEVEVFERNAIGRAFYEKVGFESDSTSVHEATGEVVLRLRLASGA